MDEKTPNDTPWEGVLIDAWNWSIRARNILRINGITTVGDLLSQSDVDLLSQRGFGETSLREIRERLAEHGLELDEWVPPDKGKR